MPLNLTEEQIIQLAPDTASVKAGKGLAVPGKWVLLACSELPYGDTAKAAERTLIRLPST